MQDQYGNQYPAVSSGFLPIVVAIPADKKQHLDNAVQALGAAGTLTVVGAVFGIIASTGVAGKWGSIGLGALASLCGVSAFASQQYASGEANQAADPPTPDYATRETVLVRGFLLAGRFPTDPELAPIGTMLQLFDLIGATQVALGQVSCKILGAKTIGDTVGLSQQQAAYQSLLAGLVDAANQLPKATANAVAVFASIFSTLTDQLAKGLTQLIAGGLDSNTRELLLKSSVPGNLIQALDDALAAKALLDPTVLLGPQLTSAAAGLSSSVNLLAQSSAQLLA